MRERPIRASEERSAQDEQRDDSANEQHSVHRARYHVSNRSLQVNMSETSDAPSNSDHSSAESSAEAGASGGRHGGDIEPP